MKLQKKAFTCGAATVVNALRAFDIRVAEHYVYKIAKTSSNDGTDESGIIHALRSWGLTASPFTSDNRAHAWRWLHGTLLSGRTVLLCADSWNHWVLCAGTLGDRVVLIDPARYRKNVRENGVHVVRKEALMRRWWNGRCERGGEKPLYAISAGK